VPSDAAIPELAASPTETPSPTPEDTPIPTPLALLLERSVAPVSRGRPGSVQYWS
jgi:hypothetical protein